MPDQQWTFGLKPRQLDRLLSLGGEDPSTGPGQDSAPFEGGLLERPGGRIGRYRLLRILGEGGMGIVYLAQQIEPVRREVALKIIKPGMDSQRVLARFEAEQQALARMDHPHIAHIYDAGLAPSGRPYFVMEHVPGIPLTKYCDEQRLTIEQRLQLLVPICRAVQHAHQKGIIHRDLKPSNILVAAAGQEVVPKIIDFGVARALNQPLTEWPLSTGQGQPIGTPEYMSPEQADPGNQDVDTRTDIYSLGVLLYELLAGVLPFDPETLRAGGLDHVRQVLGEEYPKTPSTRLGQTPVEQSTESARRRQTDVRTLRRKLRGDLDRISLKALEKDRSRRYSTADALAADICNYLNHQPVSAAPPGTLYRAGKFARRHRGTLAVMAAAIVSSLVLAWAVRAHLQAGREQAHVRALEDERILTEAQRLFQTRGIRTQGTSASLSDALALLEPLLISPHVGPQARLLFANILLENHYYREATPRLEELLDERREIAGNAHRLLARIIWESSSLGPADRKHIEEHRQQAQELLPQTAETYYLRALTAVTVQEQRTALDQALRIDPDDYESLCMLTFLDYAARKWDKMKDEALGMIYLRRSDPLGYSLRATALRELGESEEAVKCYGHALERTPRDDPEYAKLSEQYCGTLLRLGRYERVIAEAKEYLKNAPDATILPAYIFCALTALGQYEEAGMLYQHVAASNPAAGIQLRDQSMKYVFDTLDAGRTWHPPASEPQGKAFLYMLEAEETYRSLSAKAHRLIPNSFSARWSPDSRKVVLALGLPGNSGLAIYDPATGEPNLLIVPAKDPSWSPDRQHIAFVRDYEALRLSDLTTGEQKRNDYMYFRGEEVWVMDANGTRPRRLARGAGFPSWSPDAKHVYYQARMEHMLYSISIEDPQAKPEPVFPCFSYYPALSPDGNSVAYVYQEGTAEVGGVRNGVLKIAGLTTPSSLVEWAAPLVTWGGCWSPDGREFSLGGTNEVTASTGLWLYDRDKKEAVKVLSGPIVDASWSPDKRHLLISLGEPYFETWEADLAPGLSTAEALGPVRTLEEHCFECITTCNRRLEVDPNLFAAHLARTASALWIDHDQAPVYLRQLQLALDRLSLKATVYYTNAQWILVCPALRDRLLRLALVLARKAASDPACARDLAHMLCDMGQHEQAIALWRIAGASPPPGSCRYDGDSDRYTMIGAGADLWGTLDDLHFAGKKLAGDGSITARIDSIENVRPWSKAGIMLRSTLEPDSPSAWLAVTPNGRLYFRHRLTEDGISYSTDMPPNTIQLPHWLRLIRQDNRITAQHSSDGITWVDVLFGSEQPSAITIPMGEAVYIGLAVNSRDLQKTAEARFSCVTTTGNVAPLGPFTESQDIRFPPPF